MLLGAAGQNCESAEKGVLSGAHDKGPFDLQNLLHQELLALGPLYLGIACETTFILPFPSQHWSEAR